MEMVQIDVNVSEQDDLVYNIELLDIGDAAVIVDTKNKRIKRLNQTLRRVLLKSFNDETIYMINLNSPQLQNLEEEPRKVIIEAFENFNNLYLVREEQ